MGLLSVSRELFILSVHELHPTEDRFYERIEALFLFIQYFQIGFYVAQVDLKLCNQGWP